MYIWLLTMSIKSQHCRSGGRESFSRCDVNLITCHMMSVVLWGANGSLQEFSDHGEMKGASGRDCSTMQKLTKRIMIS